MTTWKLGELDSSHPTKDVRLRIARFGTNHWRTIVRDEADAAEWSVTGPPYTTCTEAMGHVDEVLRDYFGVSSGPIATWNAFSPDQLADVITGVTRSDAAYGAAIAGRLDGDVSHEFVTERRDPFSGGFIGGARWRAERAGVSDWKLHLLIAEPQGVA